MHAGVRLDQSEMYHGQQITDPPTTRPLPPPPPPRRVQSGLGVAAMTLW